MSYVRSLVNNAAVKDNLSRMGFSEDRECDCNEGVETVEHVLLECKLEKDCRQELFEKVQNMWMDSKCRGNLNFNNQTVLFLSQIHSVSQELGSRMLTESFEFLKKLSKKL